MNSNAGVNKAFVNLVTKSGPLAGIWLACHCEKRLKDKVALSTDVLEVVATIRKLVTQGLEGQIISMERSAGLLVGAVRVWAKQMDHFLSRCAEAYSKMQVSETTKSKQRGESKNKAKVKIVDNLRLDMGLNSSQADDLHNLQFLLDQHMYVENTYKKKGSDSDTVEPPSFVPKPTVEDPWGFGIIDYEQREMDLAIDYAGIESSDELEAGLVPLMDTFTQLSDDPMDDYDTAEFAYSPIEKIRGEADAADRGHRALEEEFTARRHRGLSDDEDAETRAKRDSTIRMDMMSDEVEATADFGITDTYENSTFVEEVTQNLEKSSDIDLVDLVNRDLETTTATEAPDCDAGENNEPAFEGGDSDDAMRDDDHDDDAERSLGHSDLDKETEEVAEVVKEVVLKKKRRKTEFLRLRIDKEITTETSTFVAKIADFIPQIRHARPWDCERKIIGLIPKLRERIHHVQTSIRKQTARDNDLSGNISDIVDEYNVEADGDTIQSKPAENGNNTEEHCGEIPTENCVQDISGLSMSVDAADEIYDLPLSPNVNIGASYTYTEVPTEVTSQLTTTVVQDTLDSTAVDSGTPELGAQSSPEFPTAIELMESRTETYSPMQSHQNDVENTPGKVDRFLRELNLTPFSGDGDEIGLHSVLEGANPSEAARTFFQLLVLGSRKAAKVTQRGHGDVSFIITSNLS